MIAELIETGLVIISSGIGTVIGFSIGRKEKKHQPKPQKIGIAWIFNYTSQKWVCPRCAVGIEEWHQNKGEYKHPTICECEEYEKEHYHFKCKRCDFKSIMRHANDK